MLAKPWDLLYNLGRDRNGKKSHLIFFTGSMPRCLQRFEEARTGRLVCLHRGGSLGLSVPYACGIEFQQEDKRMAVVEELIRTENNETLSFGNYKLAAKSKLDNFEFGGDLYKVKTFKEITKLERNGMFVYESVPGTAVSQLHVTDSGIEFSVEGPEDAQITLELEEQTEYQVSVGGTSVGNMKTNLGGKLSLSVELNEDAPVAVKIEKV